MDFSDFSLFLSGLLTITLPFEKLKSRKSQYVISDWQHERYNKVLKFAKFKKDKAKAPNL